MPSFYEFFAGGGMARAGLGRGWRCAFANDVDAAKGAAYAANWGGEALRLADIAALGPGDLPGRADLAWASFPCQDLSLAGKGRGLAGARSGTFWAFARLIGALAEAGRAPAIVALENVGGLLTASGGADFAAVMEELARLGYRAGAMTIDAARFVPQSRPRLFIVGVAAGRPIPPDLIHDGPAGWTTTQGLAAAQAALRGAARENWIWWRVPEPSPRNLVFADLIEDAPAGARWRTEEETAYLVSLMSEANRARLRAAQQAGRRMVGSLYRRMRRGPDGAGVQRAEIRFDDVAGCLRTPAGGSSRQTLLIVEGESVRARLLSPRECARLMGLPDDYVLPARANEAYHLLGDGVAAPVVRHLAAHLFEPLIAAEAPARLAAE